MIKSVYYYFGVMIVCGFITYGYGDQKMGTLIGRICDDATGELLPARIYITGPDGKTHLPQAQEGQTIAYYNKKRGPTENYACIAAHPFKVKLPVGKNKIQIFHGKEYAPITQEIEIIEGSSTEKTFKLIRHFNMAQKGWYSGDLHVHTPLSDLPAFQLAENLNVAFPITAWARDSREVPHNKGGKVPDKGEL
ncbi:MAG: hypothetical protein ACYTF1_18720, partial [Planctomycetota bacterium]